MRRWPGFAPTVKNTPGPPFSTELSRTDQTSAERRCIWPELGALTAFAGLSVLASSFQPVQLALVAVYAVVVYCLTRRRRDGKPDQRQLAARERLKRTLFDDAPIPMILEDWSGIKAMLDDVLSEGVTDLDGYLREHPAFIQRAQERHLFLDANRATVRLFGAESKEQLLTAMAATLPKAPTCDSVILRAFANGEQVAHGERVIQTLDGRTLTILWQADLSSGSAEHLLFTAIDITERKRMEDALISAQAELTHTSRVGLLGEMVASIAHEVNQPLAAIGIYAESCRRWLNRPEPNLARTRQSLDKIAKSAQHAGEVVRRIKGFVRREKPVFVPLNVRELLVDTEFLVQREARAHRVDLAFEVDDRLCDVMAVKVQAQQVLVNLIINAIHAFDGIATQPRRVRVLARHEADDLVTVEVRDNGPGVAEGNLERIFTPFFSTRTDGLGLGLSLSRSIVEAHGGKIYAVNRESGASFVFTLKATGQKSVQP
jgi:two-component system sensor kinase FixL